jgi:hypothetical protein
MTDGDVVTRLLGDHLKLGKRLYRGEEGVSSWVVEGPKRGLDSAQLLTAWARHLAVQLLEAIVLSIRVGDLKLANGIKVEQRTAGEAVSASLEEEADARLAKNLAAVSLERGPSNNSRRWLVVDTVLAQ